MEIASQKPTSWDQIPSQRSESTDAGSVLRSLSSRCQTLQCLAIEKAQRKDRAWYPSDWYYRQLVGKPNKVPTLHNISKKRCTRFRMLNRCFFRCFCTSKWPLVMWLPRSPNRAWWTTSPPAAWSDRRWAPTDRDRPVAKP